MSSPTIVPPLAGRVMGSADASFVVAEWRDGGAPPGPPRYIAPIHIHHHDDEAWYVLEGKLCVLIGEEQAELGVGAGVLVPKGTKHTYWNPSPEPTRYLLIMTAKIYRLIQEIHGMRERTPALLSGLFKKYDSELLNS